MTKELMLETLQKEVEGFNKIIATEKGDWIIKGFIDIYKNIYTITIDTKVVSKVMEILLIPEFFRFAKKNNLILELPKEQNSYPDLTFISQETGLKFAVDIKSTFKDTANKIKSLTLGAFTGYFRDRKSTKNTHYPYSDYAAHYVLGVIYSQIDKKPDEKAVFKFDDLDKIKSVIRDFQFFVQPKYKIASASPGSGNTKNIGSTITISKLIDGTGVFSTLGEEVFDDYWMNYQTIDMATKIGGVRPYSNLENYLEYKEKGNSILVESKEKIAKLSAEDVAEAEQADDITDKHGENE